MGSYYSDRYRYRAHSLRVFRNGNLQSQNTTNKETDSFPCPRESDNVRLLSRLNPVSYELTRAR